MQDVHGCPPCELDSSCEQDSTVLPRDAGLTAETRNDGVLDNLSRRSFVKAAGTAVAIAGVGSLATPVRAEQAAGKGPQPEKLVEQLYHSLNSEQKAKVCFDWDHSDDRGLLRTHVSNNWNIVGWKQFNVGGNFYTKDQQELIEAIFFGMYAPEWKDRIRKQLRDDAGGYGKRQTFAIFGEPGAGQFEFVMTGRHLTVRCDGNSAEHVAFGGPIFYGHAAKDSPDAFNELPDHPGNVFWPQAQQANKLLSNAGRQAARSGAH